MKFLSLEGTRFCVKFAASSGKERLLPSSTLVRITSLAQPCSRASPTFWNTRSTFRHRFAPFVALPMCVTRKSCLATLAFGYSLVQWPRSRPLSRRQPPRSNLLWRTELCSPNGSDPRVYTPTRSSIDCIFFESTTPTMSGVVNDEEDCRPCRKRPICFVSQMEQLSNNDQRANASIHSSRPPYSTL